MNTAIARLPRQTFGELLRQEREQAGLSHYDLSCRVGVDKATVRGWERGEAYPNRFEMKKLVGSMRKLRHFIHLLPTTTQHQVESDMREVGEVLPPQLAPITPPPPSFTTFAEALRHERLSEGLGQDELGELVGVTGQAVSAWENDVSAPITLHYDALVNLFPKLGSAPKPESRDIDKPNGGAGKEKPHVTHEEEPMNHRPAVARAPVAPVSERMPDFKAALIQWGRLVHALKSHPDLDLFTSYMAEASEAGMTLQEAMAALADPK